MRSLSLHANHRFRYERVCSMSKLLHNKRWSYERFTDDHFKVWKVHKREICAGSNCAIHNPSDHTLNKARIVLRSWSPFSFKPHGFVERICEHGIGHSDPDSVAFYTSIGQEGHGMHGCDGCCSGTYEEIQRS